MIKVSVIIPVYNVEKYLRECLDSVVNQTLEDIEIICIDDGSTDNSLNILKEYADKDSRFTILIQHNKGAGSARNKGMEIAKGEYIGFVDSDDWIDLDYYEKLYEKAVKENADIVRTTFNIIYTDKAEEGGQNKLIKKRIKKNQLLSSNDHFGIIWNAIYKTEFLHDNNIDYFDTDLPMCHDVPFTLRIEISAKKIIPFDKTNYYYRKNRFGQLTKLSLNRIKCTLKAGTLISEFINSCDLDENIYRNAYKYCVWMLDKHFKNALKADDFDEKEQKEYLDKFVSIIQAYKYNDYPLKVYYLLKGDYESYIKTKTNRLKYNLLKCKKFLNFEDEYTHVVITLFGIKLKIRTQKCPPPRKTGIILKNHFQNYGFYFGQLEICYL